MEFKILLVLVAKDVRMQTITWSARMIYIAHVSSSNPIYVVSIIYLLTQTVALDTTLSRIYVHV